MIPQRDLSLLSNRLARLGGRRIPEAILEKDYCLSWCLAGMSATSLKQILAFKGGTAIKKCYIPDYRFSEDLDFTLREETSFETVKEHLDEAFVRVKEASGVKISFSRYDRHSHENSHTFYIAYEGPLPGASGKEVKVDITIRERLFFPVATMPLLRAYAEYRDLPLDATIGVYSLNEIAAEKFVALFDPARNEPRDLYDLWRLSGNGLVNPADLIEAVMAKMAFHNKTLTDSKDIFHRKEARLKKLWTVRLSAQMADLPAFDEAYRAVTKGLRKEYFG
ncbi:MAG TPA: nucleotidyl transferase AbiEii/AbiGii toxin family protein [Syntrophales bacterium]|nr:nucleotidyl transferase AbiEii/AbiGii toxin family protein [Syntrophales bacterium]